VHLHLTHRAQVQHLKQLGSRKTERLQRPTCCRQHKLDLVSRIQAVLGSCYAACCQC
jgi:hypothetical protein